MENVYIVSAVRTAIGKMGGTLKFIPAEELAKIAIEEALKRANITGEVVDEVIMGQAKQSSDAPNLARVAALLAGLPVEVPAYTVMRQCASGMQSVQNAAQAIQCGLGDVFVAGGVENMSDAPYYLRKARYGYTVGNSVLVDPIPEGQFRCQPQSMFGTFNMGITAENLAKKYNISREEQDAYSFQSQSRARRAIDDGTFAQEIVPVPVPQKKAPPIMFDTDEHPRLSSLEKLATLKPAFQEGGTVTAGNSSGRNDGASALVLMSEAGLKKTGAKPIAKVISQASVGVSPEIMGIGPVQAIYKALDRAGLKLEDIGLAELNEAFAAQTLAVLREVPLDQSIVNVNGGAIALGHPLGCSGARILTTLVYEMQRRGTRYGLAALCVGGGQGSATIVELCD